VTHSLRIREYYRLIAIALLCLPQFLRGEPLLRDVAEDEDRPVYGAGFIAYRRADIFDRKAAAVLAKEYLVLYLARPAVPPVRTQNFDFLGFPAVDGIAEGCADQCGGRLAKQCFRGGVDELDFTASIEHQHRFRLVCDQIPETRFAGAQRADQFPLPQDTAHTRQQFVVRYRTNDITVGVGIQIGGVLQSRTQ